PRRRRPGPQLPVRPRPRPAARGVPRHRDARVLPRHRPRRDARLRARPRACRPRDGGRAGRLRPHRGPEQQPRRRGPVAGVHVDGSHPAAVRRRRVRGDEPVRRRTGPVVARGGDVPADRPVGPRLRDAGGRTRMTGPADLDALPDPGRAFGADDVDADRLGDVGYRQEEFLLSGAACGEPFRTRLLVRRPAGPGASGVVVVEPMHFAGGRPVWGHARAQLLRGGHAWVEVACQTTPAYRRMVASDPRRYARVRLAGTPSDARPEAAPGADLRRASAAFARQWWDSSPQLFAILTAVFALLRDGGLPGVRAETIVLAGASQTGGVIRRYACLAAAGGPLARAARPHGLLALHSGGPALPAELDLPTVELVAESEIESVRAAAG